MVCIALDAMGSDRAPAAEVAGATLALEEIPDLSVLLVGRAGEIESVLAQHAALDQARVEIVDAPDVVGMGEQPLAAIRSKPRSSIAVAMSQHKEGRADACVSAGNTGAILAAATLMLRLHDGVQRAAVGTLFPTARQPVLVIDGGTNVDCSPREVVGFAHLGTVYARDVLQRPEPAVGLINIGEEREKGNALAKEAHQLLANEPLRFVGNVEGRDILAGECAAGPLDVAVCDGFVGNVLLKFYESVARLFVSLVAEAAPDVLERPEVGKVLRTLDYSEYGGAPLLGVRGVSIICHGSSPPRAIKNALRVAHTAVTSHLSQHIGAEMAPGGGSST